MKRSKSSSRAMRQRTTSAIGGDKGRSRYGQKVRAKNQMYGPGCCAHSSKAYTVAA